MRIIDFLTSLSDFLNHINTYIQFLLVMIAFLTSLFLFTIPYVKPLRKLLGPLGLSYFEIYRVLLRCYKKPRKLIRVYIELAMIKTKGIIKHRKWWNKFHSEFTHFIDEYGISGHYVARIETCFEITSTEFAEVIKKYFEYFRADKMLRKFAIPIDQPVSFLIQLEINEGFLVPITFITGLNDRFDEDWEKILGNYFNAFIEEAPPQTAILSDELYYTYNWLMWGPSYHLEYSKTKSKLIQYGFGDESNSINIIIRYDKIGNQIWDIICNEGNEENRQFGVNCSIKGALIDTSEYYQYKIGDIDLCATSFLKRLSLKELGTPYLMELDNYEIKHSIKSENYFFSAYLWIMFAVVDETRPGFTPRKSLTFFEHANLANKNNYHFLTESLINKCIAHFQLVSQHKVNRVRKYQLCLCMNNYIEQLFKERLKKIQEGNPNGWFTTNLLLETSFSISEILNAFDNYFVTQYDDVTLVKVDLSDKESIKHLCNFYAEIYFNEFDNCPAALSLDRMLSLLKMKTYDPSLYIILAINPEGITLGGGTAIYLPGSKYCIIDSIVVGTNYRNNGVGKKILDRLINVIQTDVVYRQRRKISGFAARVPFESNQETMMKFRFWLNNEFKHIPEYTRENYNGWAIKSKHSKPMPFDLKVAFEQVIKEYDSKIMP